MPANLGRQLSLTPLESASGFHAALIDAGFEGPRGRNSITMPFRTAFGATGTFSGDIEDFEPRRFVAPDLGFDRRWLWPTFPVVDVDAGTTGIQSFKQMSRSLADPNAMVRSITATTAKPETDTNAEVVAAELKQVATISSGVPNVLIQSADFRSFVETDLRLVFGEAMDGHAVAEIAAAGPVPSAPGANLLEGARYAMADVQSAGYDPSVIAASAEDFVTLDLLTSSGPEADYAFAIAATASNASNLWGLRKVVVKNLAAPLVIDVAAAGTLYRGPITFAAFEEAAGQTNSATLRLEANALLVIQRPDAIAEIGGGS